MNIHIQRCLFVPERLKQAEVSLFRQRRRFKMYEYTVEQVEKFFEEYSDNRVIIKWNLKSNFKVQNFEVAV